MNLCDRNEIQELLQRHGFRFSRSMGQNFLIESWVPEDIAAASGADRQTGVLEIGPGIGPLTQQLARRAGKVYGPFCVPICPITSPHLSLPPAWRPSASTA